MDTSEAASNRMGMPDNKQSSMDGTRDRLVNWLVYDPAGLLKGPANQRRHLVHQQLQQCHKILNCYTKRQMLDGGERACRLD